jgi:hypothetical protein
MGFTHVAWGWLVHSSFFRDITINRGGVFNEFLLHGATTVNQFPSSCRQSFCLNLNTVFYCNTLCIVPKTPLLRRQFLSNTSSCYDDGINIVVRLIPIAFCDRRCVNIFLQPNGVSFLNSLIQERSRT